MIIDKQQEGLLFTLSFDQLDRMYGGVELTVLEKELFRRVKTLTEEQTETIDVLDNYGMHLVSLESDIESVMETIRDLEIDVDNLKDELKEKEKDNGIDNLKYEIQELKKEKDNEIDNLKYEIQELKKEKAVLESEA